MSRLVPFLPLLLMTCLLLSMPASAQTLSFATGNTSGTYYPYGGGLCSIWSKHLPHVNIKAEVTGASVTNIIQVARKESEVALVQGDTFVNAREGTGQYPEKLPVSMLFAAYPQVVHVLTLADSGITGLADLAGKRVSLGAPGSGTAMTAGLILDALGIDRSGMELQNLSYSETVNALRDGNLDAGFIVAGAGVSAVVELALTRDIQLIAFSDEQMQKIMQAHDAYTAFTLPPGVYHGVDAPVQLPTLWNLVIVHDEMPEELVYALTKTTFEQIEALREISHVAKFTTPESAAAFAPSQFHPGALRYYREHGYFTEVAHAGD